MYTSGDVCYAALLKERRARGIRALRLRAYHAAQAGSNAIPPGRREAVQEEVQVCVAADGPRWESIMEAVGNLLLSAEELGSLKEKRVFVTGATSPLGEEICRCLAGASRIRVLLRDRGRGANLPGDVEIIEGTCEEPRCYQDHLKESTVVIHIAGMHLASWVIRACAGHDRLERILFISSVRALYPDRMLSAREASTKKMLLEKEEEVSSSLLPWTILRSTLIFSRRDRSISRVVRWISKRRYVALPGMGKAVKQPISARDLAASVIRALLSPSARQRAFNVPGEDVTVREMMTTISGVLGKNVRFIPVPRRPVAVLKSACELLGLDGPGVSLQAFLRWYEDMRFGGDEAREAFGHAPRSFEESIREQLEGEFALDRGVHLGPKEGKSRMG